MIEGQHAEFVGGIQQLEEKLFDRRAGIGEPLTIHAVAHVEQHGQADRHAFVRELRHGLALAVLVDLECVFGKAGHQPAVMIYHGGGDADEVNARTERVGWCRGAPLRCKSDAGERRDKHPEPAAHDGRLEG